MALAMSRRANALRRCEEGKRNTQKTTRGVSTKALFGFGKVEKLTYKNDKDKEMGFAQYEVKTRSRGE